MSLKATVPERATNWSHDTTDCTATLLTGSLVYLHCNIVALELEKSFLFVVRNRTTKQTYMERVCV